MAIHLVIPGLRSLNLKDLQLEARRGSISTLSHKEKQFLVTARSANVHQSPGCLKDCLPDYRAYPRECWPETPSFSARSHYSQLGLPGSGKMEHIGLQPIYIGATNHKDIQLQWLWTSDCPDVRYIYVGSWSRVKRMERNLLWTLQAGNFSLDGRAPNQLLSAFNAPKKAGYRKTNSVIGNLTAGPRGQSFITVTYNLLPCKLAGKKNPGKQDHQKKKE